MSTAETPNSLRERSRLRRRRAIQLAGMRLFADRGYDATTIAEIAAHAEVSARTVTLYFPTKLDIALASTNSSLGRLAGELQASPNGTLFIDVFMSWLEHEPDHVDTEERVLRSRMFLANQTLGGMAIPNGTLLGHLSADFLAAEFSVTPEHPTVRLAIGVTIGIIQQHEILPDSADPTETTKLVRAALCGAFAGLSEDHAAASR